MSDAKTPLLNDDELTLLDSFMLSEACGDDTLSIDEAHGFMTALALCQSQTQGDELQREVWGEPAFESDEQRSQMQGLLTRLNSDMIASLAGRRDFEPLVVEVEDEGELVEAYEGWCYGFMLGIEHEQERWDTLPKQEQALVAPMASLALLNDSEEEVEMSEDEYADWVDLLPGAVMGLYDWWQSEAKAEG